MKTPSMSSTFRSDNVTAWLNNGHFRELDCRLGSVKIFCVDENSQTRNHPNPPQNVLFIHGFPTSSYDFAGQWSRLKHEYRLVTLDMLGFGFSEKPDGRLYSIHQQADLFESLIKSLEIDSLHVIAHDYGVSVAQELLARQIDGIGAGKWLSCTLLNGGLFPETHHALPIQKVMLSPLGKWVNKLTGFTQFSRSFSRVFGPETKPSDFELSEFWEIINANEGRHVFHNLITYIEDRKTHRSRWLKALRESPVPIAVINGSKDPVSGSHLVQRYRQLNCRLDYLKELPTIGHYPQVEAPVEVTDAILEFLKQTHSGVSSPSSTEEV